MRTNFPKGNEAKAYKYSYDIHFIKIIDIEQPILS